MKLYPYTAKIVGTLLLVVTSLSLMAQADPKPAPGAGGKKEDPKDPKPTDPKDDPSKAVKEAEREPKFKLFLFSGATLQNPYNISLTSSNATLQKTSSTTDGYIEAFLSARFISRSNFVTGEDEPQSGLVSPFVIDLGKWKASRPDMQFRLGYVFRGKSAPTNYSAQTIVGGSDIYGEVSMGFPFYRYVSDDKMTKGQATLEFSGGFVTDRDFMIVHPNAFFGGGYQLKDIAHGNTWYWISRVGIGLVDTPELAGGSTVALDRINQPAFRQTWAPTLGTQIILGLTPAISLQAGANVYLTPAPSSWNVTVGVSIDLGKFFGK